MSYLFKEFISEDIVESKFQDKYGKKYKLKMDMQYQFQYKSHKMDIGFTADRKGFWIFKYKEDYYMNIIEDITFTDKYEIIDIYTTLMDNAVNTYKMIVGGAKLRKEAIAKRKKK